MSPHICLVWLVLRYEPCPWSSRENTCWVGLALTSSSSQLSRSRWFSTDRISTKKEPCLTPTLMDEGQARNPNTTYNGYKMEFWKFALTWKLICPVQHKITQKEQKETTKKGGISLTIMGQRQTYNSIHKPSGHPTKR